MAGWVIVAGGLLNRMSFRPWDDTRANGFERIARHEQTWSCVTHVGEALIDCMGGRCPEALGGEDGDWPAICARSTSLSFSFLVECHQTNGSLFSLGLPLTHKLHLS